MNKIRNRFTLHTFVILLLSFSCSSQTDICQQPPISMPDVDIPVCTNGEYILLETPEGWNSFSVIEPVVLRITNVSSDKVYFPPDFGVRLFISQGDQWIELENAMNSMLMPPVELEPNPGQNPLKAEALPVFPELESELLENYGSEITLRIVVVGEIRMENKIQPVSSFIDIVLINDKGRKL